MIKLAVIGTGAMGRNHARILRGLPDVSLLGVADVNESAAVEVGALYGAQAFTDHRRMLAEIELDAVTVAVPPHLHRDVVLDALSAGCHVLVEKPVATTVEQAEQMVASAEQASLVLMVGHIERYNPAIASLKARLQAGELGRVFQIVARRLGPFPARVRDVGVVIDLATHDLDIMRYLSGSEVVRVYAETRRGLRTPDEDLLSGLLRFENDVVGLLEVNWLTPMKIRELTVIGELGMFRADYLTQDLYFHQNSEHDLRTDAGPERWLPMNVFRGVDEGAITRFPIHKREPLQVELEVFVAAANGQGNAHVTGRHGLEALRLAQLLIRSGHEHRALESR